MKVSSIGVTKIDNGVRLTVSADFARNEEFEASDALVLVDTFREIAGRFDLPTGGTNDDSAAASSDAPSSGRRSRRGSTGETAPAESEGASRRSRRGETGASDGDVDKAADGEGSSSRRRRGTDGAASAPAASESDGSWAAPSRRRRGGNTEAAPEAKTEEAAPSRRSRRTASAAKEEGVTNEDLAKACSEAAAEIGSDLVFTILKEDHSVERVNELPQDEREKFLKTLAEEIKAQKKG